MAKINEKTIGNIDDVTISKIVDQVLSFFPGNKNMKDTIITSILNKNQKHNLNVLEKIYHSNISFYRDSSGKLLDANLQLIGVYQLDTTTSTYTYYIFDELIN